MDFPEGDVSKWRVAADLAVGLAQVAHQSGDPVGVLVPGIPGAALPLRTRHGVVSEISALLERVSPGAPPLRDLGLRRQRLPSRVVLLSDFLDDDPATTGVITAHRAQGGEVHAVRMIAPQELDPPGQAFTAVDPENPELSRPFALAIRPTYLQRFTAWGSGVAARWRAAGARWNEVVTDEPLLHAIRRVVGGVA